MTMQKEPMSSLLQHNAPARTLSPQPRCTTSQQQVMCCRAQHESTSHFRGTKFAIAINLHATTVGDEFTRTDN